MKRLGTCLFLLFALQGCANRYSPFGQINHRFVQQPFDVDDATLGRSGGFPAVLRILVSPEARGQMGYIGRLVDKALFRSEKYPDFAFNVAFACARVGFCGGSAYADPRSPWFNIFFGYYEIDAPKALWKRPFGYTSDRIDAEIDFEDIARIGVADWNYFSNHLYGVPLSAITPLDEIDFTKIVNARLPREQVGEWWLDHVTTRGVRVVTPYRSTIDHGQFADDAGPIIGGLWRRAFGVHAPDDFAPKSFFPVEMRAEILMSFASEHDEDFHEDVYRTVIFGATTTDTFGEPKDPKERERFLKLQLDALRKVIAREGIGFRDPVPLPARPMLD